MVAEVIEQHGRLDILINNAGITIDKTVLKLTDDDWRKVLDVNLSGAFFLSQAALAHMVERGTGRIINVSSIIGEMGNIGQANYAASKSGLFGLTKTLAREAAFMLERSGKLDEDGIGLTVNTVTPGYTMTEMVAAVPEKVLDKIKAADPDAPPRPSRRGRPDRALPGRRRVVLHHRPGLGRQRRHGHVTPMRPRSAHRRAPIGNEAIAHRSADVGAPCRRSSRRLKSTPAVDVDQVPGDERRVLGAEVRHGAGDVVGLAGATERVLGQSALSPRRAWRRSSAVSMKPGRTPLTVVPNRASSNAPVRTRPTTPALAAV